jgi:hypothetical protein
MTTTLKTLTSQELNNMLDLHKQWLEGRNSGVQADFSNTDLSNLDLSNLFLMCIVVIMLPFMAYRLLKK